MSFVKARPVCAVAWISRAQTSHFGSMWTSPCGSNSTEPFRSRPTTFVALSYYAVGQGRATRAAIAGRVWRSSALDCRKMMIAFCRASAAMITATIASDRPPVRPCGESSRTVASHNNTVSKGRAARLLCERLNLRGCEDQSQEVRGAHAAAPVSPWKPNPA